MRPDCIDITIVRDTGSMNRQPKSIPVEANTRFDGKFQVVFKLGADIEVGQECPSRKGGVIDES